MQIIILESLGLSAEKMKVYLNDMHKNGHDILYYEQKSDELSVNIDRAKDADILMLVNMNISRDLLSKCSNLKFISVAFTGVDHIDMEYCKLNNIVVSNAAGYSTTAVAELTLNMALSLLRETNWAEIQTRMGGTRNGMLGEELAGKTVGIIGTGAIGIHVAEIFNFMGCRVIAHSRTPKNIDFITYLSKEEVLKQGDIITLHLPLTSETANFIDEQAFKLMKKTALIINTARGNVVDIPELAKALKTGRIAGAAVDVYEKEPPLALNHPLFDAPNTILLPHIGYATIEAIERRTKIVFDNIMLWSKGEAQNVM